MVEQPFFSIIIPVYNTEQHIKRCLESCVNQSFKNIEIIIIDDCGSDNAIKKAEDIAKNDPRIHIVQNPKNLGVFVSRIEGGKNARGEYIIYLDSDDFIDVQMCQTLYQTITTHECKKDEGGGGYNRF